MSLVRPLRQLQFPIRVSVLCSQACNADLAAIGEPHLRWNALPARSRQRIDEVERMVGTRNFLSSPRSAAVAGVLAARLVQLLVRIDLAASPCAAPRAAPHRVVGVGHQWLTDASRG